MNAGKNSTALITGTRLGVTVTGRGRNIGRVAFGRGVVGGRFIRKVADILGTKGEERRDFAPHLGIS